MEAVRKDMHLKIVVNVHLATLRTRSENARKVGLELYYYYCSNDRIIFIQCMLYPGLTAHDQVTSNSNLTAISVCSADIFVC